jgi:hypothetical protein
MAPDALFVVHRLTDRNRLAEICRRRGHRQIVLVSTHRFFAHEQQSLAALLAPTRIDFLVFADILDDQLAAGIDDATTAELLSRPEPPVDYIRNFQTKMLLGKNAAVHHRLPIPTAQPPIYADDGLGVSWAYWRQHGATALTRLGLGSRLRQSAWGTAWSRWRRTRRLPANATWLRDQSDRYLFLGDGARRLPLRAGVAAETAPFSRHQLRQADFVATTIHDYWPVIHSLGRPARIFADGLLPSNYSRSYLDGYGPAEYIAPDPFSARWLQRHGKSTVPPPGFLAPPECSPASIPSGIRTVVCLLNHTGDWTALVNRSDTDTLAEAFTALAANAPDIRFVLRPHPGMDHPDHEGRAGIQRLVELVRQSGLPNLTLSRTALAPDLDRGDLFVSEYSATLLEAWRRGKPGIIVNLTGRRSFMEDFARLGFAQVSTPKDLSALLAQISTQPGDFLLQHNAAVIRYNEALKAYLAQP